MNIHQLRTLGRTDELTDRQRETLTIIGREILAKGVPPTYRELGDLLGRAAVNGVNDAVNVLIRKGYLVKRAEMKARSLALTRKARAELGIKSSWPDVAAFAAEQIAALRDGHAKPWEVEQCLAELKDHAK